MPARRILIIDDDDDVRESLEDLIASEGFEVSVARSAPAALSDMTYGRIDPHAILIDMRMPSMSGAQFLAVMRKNPRWSRIPVILCSAGTVHPEACHGAFEVLEKPFNLAELLSALNRAVAHGVMLG
jgi:CheY-like chemotaxis protein